jgi:hypothetical protein
VEPPDGATNVDTAVVVSAEFDRTLDPSSVTEMTFSLSRNGEAVAGSLEIDGSTAEFTPSVPLALEQLYTATLTTGIMDAAGNPLQESFTWDFNTREGAWSEATRLDTSSGEANDGRVAVDADGSGIAVWEQGDDIWASRYAAGAGWGAAQVIDGNNREASSPELAMNEDGRAFAVWAQENDQTGGGGLPGRDVWAKEFLPDGGSVAPQLLAGGDASFRLSQHVAIDAAGNAVVVWGQSGAVWSNSFAAANSTWGGPTMVDPGSAGDPKVAMNAYGLAHAIWTGTNAVRTSRMTPGSTWGAAESLQDPALGTLVAPIPQIAADGGLGAVAVWQQPASDGASESLLSARFGSTSAWGDAEFVEQGSGTAFNSRVAMDAAGNGIAVWQQLDGAGFSVWANRSTPSETWGTAQLLELDNSAHAVGPGVSMEPGGRGAAVWSQGSNTWAARFLSDETWSLAERLEDTQSSGSFPDVAMSSNGTITVVWIRADQVWSSRFE